MNQAMNQDVSYWLEEVQSLQQQLVLAQQERESAHAAATNWRQRFETEARQRRSDAELAQTSLAKLQAEIQYLRGLEAPEEQATELGFAKLNPTQLDHLTSAELMQRVTSLQQECDRLIASLQQEREQHEQTRQSLTLALGDAVDQLSKYKEKPKTANSVPSQTAASIAPSNN
ncbi:MAG: hypothetical protein AAGF24_03555 [Cyanobacteria bacterium P01_H01_bin.121]